MEKQIVIFGCGGHGREMAALAERMRQAGQGPGPAGFCDENPELAGSTVAGLPVLGQMDWARANKDSFSFVCAIGTPSSRRRAVERLDAMGVRWATLVDPDVPLGSDTRLGEGCMVCAGTRMTTNVRIGRHAIVNLGCTLSHDVELGDFATLACGVHLSGNVKVGEGAEIGVGANVIQGMSVGPWSIVGAGAAVISDIPPQVTAVGVPARVIKETP